jgi:sphingomyelin phosphodiesterase acid-like 3
MENSDMLEPMVRHNRRRSVKSSKIPWCVAAVATVAATAVAIFLAVAWVKELPCNCSDCVCNRNLQATFPSSWIKFYHLSDVHLDPDYVDTISAATFCRNSTNFRLAANAPYGRIGCDSPELLVRNTFHAMKNASKDEKPDFIIITGDMAGHRLGSPTGTSVLNAIAIATDELEQTFPYTYVFPCLGNNDIPKDYYIPPEPNATVWYNKLMEVWKGRLMCSNCHWQFGRPPIDGTEFNKTFLVGGYYKAQLSSNLILLVLNTNYFSTKASNISGKNSGFLQAAKMQLDWLKSELQEAKEQDMKVIISGHIPPGVDPYSLNPFWFENYTNLYISYTAMIYPDIIAGQIFGHLHKDDFRFFYGDSNNQSVQYASSILLTASVTPVYKNNPSFRLVYVNDETRSFADYKQWYLDLAIADGK